VSVDPDLPPPQEPVLHGCFWDDVTRTVTCYDESENPTTRPYDDSENENADRLAAQAAADAAALTITQALNDALVALQAIIDDTNANINSSPASRIKDLARAERRVIRLLCRRFDGTS
jgi:hypothetical protein